MWFVFPLFAGLGRGSTSNVRAITGLDEARDYLVHEILGPRLGDCTAAMLGDEGD